jgi:hypothetical protein
MLTTVYGFDVLQVLEETGIAVEGACVCCSRLLGGVFESVLDGIECAPRQATGSVTQCSCAALLLPLHAVC